jgi:hypothetical protein
MNGLRVAAFRARNRTDTRGLHSVLCSPLYHRVKPYGCCCRRVDELCRSSTAEERFCKRVASRTTYCKSSS